MKALCRTGSWAILKNRILVLIPVPFLPAFTLSAAYKKRGRGFFSPALSINTVTLCSYFFLGLGNFAVHFGQLLIDAEAPFVFLFRQLRQALGYLRVGLVK